MLLALAPARATIIVYQGDTTLLSVIDDPLNTYEWEIYDDGTVNVAIVPGNCPVTSASFIGSNTGASVNVKWLKPGIYYYKVTVSDLTGCSMNFKIGMIEVNEALSTATLSPPNPEGICLGQTAMLEVNLTGKGPWNLTYTDGTNIWTVNDINDSKYLLRVSPKVLTNYWITEVSDGNGKNTKPSPKVFIDVYLIPVISKIYPNSP
jgi:hypothetical protein